MYSTIIYNATMLNRAHLYGPDDARLRGDGEGVAAVVVVAAAEVGRARRRLRRRRGRGHVGRAGRGGGGGGRVVVVVVVRRPAAVGIQLRGPSKKTSGALFRSAIHCNNILKGHFMNPRARTFMNCCFIFTGRPQMLLSWF